MTSQPHSNLPNGSTPPWWGINDSLQSQTRWGEGDAGEHAPGVYSYFFNWLHKVVGFSLKQSNFFGGLSLKKKKKRTLEEDIK